MEVSFLMSLGALLVGASALLLLPRILERRESRLRSRVLLEAGVEGEGRAPTAVRPRSSPRGTVQIDPAHTGLDSVEKVSRFHRYRRLALGGGVGIGMLLWFIGGTFDPVRAVAFIGGGYFVGYFVGARYLKHLTAEYQRDLEFQLPLVMERLVMAVHAGLDVTAALRSVLEHEQFGGAPLSSVSRLLQNVLALTEAGLTFDEALRVVGEGSPCPAVRHAFLHLGTAHREGGELVMPLRELSDATQLYFQETLEEEVARMPVKATVPLVITFAGLIMIFVAMPLVQVMSMMKRNMPSEAPYEAR